MSGLHRNIWKQKGLNVDATYTRYQCELGRSFHLYGFSLTISEMEIIKHLPYWVGRWGFLKYLHN